MKLNLKISERQKINKLIKTTLSLQTKDPLQAHKIAQKGILSRKKILEILKNKNIY